MRAHGAGGGDEPPPPAPPPLLHGAECSSESSTDEANAFSILLVDDGGTTGRILSAALTYCRHSRVSYAAGVREAAAAVRGSGPYGLIVCNVAFGSDAESGLAFLSWLRNFERERGWERGACAVMSVDRAHLDRALRAGADSFLCKFDDPVREIVSLVEDIRESRRAPLST